MVSKTEIGGAEESASYKGVWVFAEQKDGNLRGVGLELLGVGRRLADRLGEELVAVLLGCGIEELAKDLVAYGADKIILAEHELLGRYTTETYMNVLAELVYKYKPSVLLMGGTLNGRELAPRLAARLSTGITADCTDFDIDKDGHLLQIKPFSKLMAKIKCRTKPQMATAKPNAFKRLKPDWSRKATVIREEVKVSPNETRTRVIEVVKTTNSIYGNVEEADAIVAGGRGLGSKENFKLIHDLADLLGATVAGTRSVVDRGWLPASQQVGQSGKMVTPRLYIAVGISGATYHTVGMQKSEVIVAINKDVKAPIFQIATYGIVGDLFEILPIFMDRLKKEYQEGVDIEQPSEQKPSNPY